MLTHLTILCQVSLSCASSQYFYGFCWFPRVNYHDVCSAGITFGLFYQVPFRDFPAGAGVAGWNLRRCPSQFMRRLLMVVLQGSAWVLS